jgi:K+-transporting ATPase ATPase C chain
VTDRAGRVIGSSLLAQPFAKDEYLHPRPSAAGSNGYDPTSSGGSNYGPLSPDLAKRIAGDAAALRKSTGQQQIPDDAITTSGSGLDPDISPAYADLQAGRIARARGVPVAEVRKIIDGHVDGALLGFIGQPRVNVLMTNLALDAAVPKGQPRG